MERNQELKKLAGQVAAHFVAVKGENENLKIQRQERVGLLLATIKRDAPEMTQGEQVAVTYAFGVALGAAGMAASTSAVRRSEMLFLLEHSNLSEDGANQWRKTVDAARRSLEPAREILEADIETAKAAVTRATERLAELTAELVGLENAEAYGVL